MYPPHSSTIEFVLPGRATHACVARTVVELKHGDPFAPVTLCAHFCSHGYTDILHEMTKILISIDDRLLERLDKEAAALGISRSALIARLTAAALGEPVGPGANP